MKRRALLKQMGAAAATWHLSACARLGVLAQTQPPTPGIFLNQLGFRPSDSKVASVSNLSAPASAFLLRPTASRAVAFEGKLLPPAHDPASGDSVQLADFSALTTPGTYILEAGAVKSDPFPIQPNAYKDALRTTMRAFYGQRCGCAVDLGGGYKHPACHADGAFHASSGKSGTLANSGGWHDAGDYGRYIVNSGISTGTLLWAWELYPHALHSLTLAIPESGGKLPDFLTEVRWNLLWMLSLQDTDGGVWHKQTSEKFCAFIMPEADRLPSYVIGTGEAPYKSTAATGDLAAVAAIAARCYAPYDPAFAQLCLAASRRAWTWAVAHPAVTFRNPPGVSTGEYGDGSVADELLWASAELWRTTGEPQYEQQFLHSLPLETLRIQSPSWGNVAPLALWTYALAPRPGSSEVKARIHAATAETATALIAAGTGNGYGNTLSARDYGWGSNSDAGNHSLSLLIAHRFAPSEASTRAAAGNLHYLLGRNCHGVSWVTGVGTHPFLHPHHRPSAADGIPAPWPGMLSGGPNAHPGDPVARKLPAAPPMRMWVDDERAYSMNEIAINWNAPLVFLLAALNQP